MPDIKHADRINRWREFAKNRGWKKVAYPAPHERILNRMGFECPPSIFWPPWALGVLTGGFWGMFWGAFMYLTVWRDKTFFQIAVLSTLGGFLFGLGMAVFHWYQKRKLGITTWGEFVEKHSDSRDRA